MRLRSPRVRLALLLALLLAGCSRDPSPNRVLVLALDGIDPDVVDLLVSEGKLPNFARLQKEGASGRLRSEKPLLSPIVWTTIATGKPPARHGIGHFVAEDARTGEPRPVTSRMRKVAALWNIFSDAGRTVAVVGWWATWPPEPVRGAVVSDHAAYHFLFKEGFAGDGPGATTHPPELAREIAPLLRRPGDLTARDLAPFVTVPPAELGRPFDFNDDLQHFRWALATAGSYRDVGLKLWREEQPDLALVYIEGTDTTSHLFGHLFRAQGLAGELAVQQRRYGRAVEEMYVFADRLVGDFLAAMDDRTTLAVLSDHGFELGALPDDPSVTRDLRRVSERSHRLEGILYLYGQGVRPGTRLDSPRILDVAPTLLAVAGLAPARDMPGRVLSEGLERPEPQRIATYEKGSKGREGEEAGGGDPAGDALVKHLRSLGYLGSEGSDRSPRGDRNLAILHFQEGRLAEAEALYAKLLAESPEDPTLHASYAGVLGALGRFGEARRHLEKALALDPLNSEAHHNLAVLYEKAGEREGAVEEYKKALRYNPRYEPSRKALVRLTGSDAVGPPGTPAEETARALAERAADKARRGDYPGAKADLDEAARMAPRFALVYQYRANVSYLLGDEAAAIADLEKALALEPDNALYRENLKRLREGS